MQIRYVGNSQRRWHQIESTNSDDVTEAMNIPGGVLIRSTRKHHEWLTEETATAAMSCSIAHVEGLAVAQRWTVELVDADPDEDCEAFIGLSREVFLTTPLMVFEDSRRGLVIEASAGRPARFRMYSADEDMPALPDEIVRAVAENRRPPTEIEALRSEIDWLKVELAETQGVADYYLAQRDHLLGDLTWDEATADNPMVTAELDDGE